MSRADVDIVHPDIRGVVLAEASPSPSDSQAIAAWRRRLGRRPVPLVLLIAVDDDRAIVVGPGGDPPPVVELDPRAVVDDIAEAARLDALDVRERLPRVWDRARAAGLGGERSRTASAHSGSRRMSEPRGYTSCRPSMGRRRRCSRIPRDATSTVPRRGASCPWPASCAR